MKNSDTKPHILIVDDETDILEFLRFNFEQKGYKVQTAENGKKALEKIRKHQPDIILLDVMMPKMDGFETAARIREMPRGYDPVIIFLTARSDEVSELSGFRSGADDYIAKPIRIATLMARIEAIFKRRAKTIRPDSPVLKFGDLTIDVNKRKVYVRDKEVALPRMEYNILMLLVSEPGKVFTRDEIYDEVWGNQVIVGDRTLDVHIRKLRKNIGENFIKTHKGIGYSFVSD